jgi:hypothetical protein
LTQYNINSLRMLAATGPFDNGVLILAASNTFLGEGAGVSTTPSATLSSTTGKFNTFVGANAGKANTNGINNSFFGHSAGPPPPTCATTPGWSPTAHQASATKTI